MNSDRIKALADDISKKDIVLDVGCDHGYLSIYLKTNNLCKEVYASDIKESALNVAIKNFKKYNLDIKTYVSDGFEDFKGLTVGVCDERSEIAASFRGRTVNDIGIRTDVIDSCPKSKGIMLLLRSMSPEIIAADEIGTQDDMLAIKTAVISGVRLICTAHGEDIRDAERYRGIFDRYVLLCGPDNAGKIKAVYDDGFKELTMNGV